MVETKKPHITANPPSLGIGFLFTLLSFGMSIAPTFLANLMVCGVSTNAVINAMNHEKVKIVAHLDDSRYAVDYEKVVKAAKEKGIVFEINNSSLKPNTFREGAWNNVKELLKYCKKYDVNVIMGSDAHICYDVGNFTYSEKIIQDNDFPKELVINYSEDKIKELLNI